MLSLPICYSPAAFTPLKQNAEKTKLALLLAHSSRKFSSHPFVSRLRKECCPGSVRGVRNLYGRRLTRKVNPSANSTSAGEQTSSELATYQVLAKGKTMPEQTTSYMAELDQWSEANIIGPLLYVGPKEGDQEAVIAQVKKAIRAKVLDSYRNGQANGPRKAFKRR